MCGLFFFLLLFCVTCRVLSKKTNFVCVCASVCLTVLLLFFFLLLLLLLLVSAVVLSNRVFLYGSHRFIATCV